MKLNIVDLDNISDYDIWHNVENELVTQIEDIYPDHNFIKCGKYRILPSGPRDYTRNKVEYKLPSLILFDSAHTMRLIRNGIQLFWENVYWQVNTLLLTGPIFSRIPRLYVERPSTLDLGCKFI